MRSSIDSFASLHRKAHYVFIKIVFVHKWKIGAERRRRNRIHRSAREAKNIQFQFFQSNLMAGFVIVQFPQNRIFSKRNGNLAES